MDSQASLHHAAALGALVIGILLFAPKAWLAVVAIAIGIATWEVTKRLREADVLVPRLPLLAGGQAMIWLGWPYGTTGVLGAFAGTVVVTMLWRLFDHGLVAQPRNYLRDTAVAVFVAAWLPLLASFATLNVVPALARALDLGAKLLQGPFDGPYGVGAVLCGLEGEVFSILVPDLD